MKQISNKKALLAAKKSLAFWSSLDPRKLESLCDPELDTLGKPMFIVSTVQRLVLKFKENKFTLHDPKAIDIAFKIQDAAKEKYPHFNILISGARAFEYTIQYETTSESLMNTQMQKVARFIIDEGKRYGLELA